MFSPNEVRQSDKLRFGNLNFYSKNVINTKTSFLVCFNYENRKAYGEIQYFLSYQDTIYALVLKYKTIKKNIFSDIRGRVKATIQNCRERGLFDKYFCIIEKTFEYILVSPLNIINNCFSFKLDDNNFYAIDYSYEAEHD